MPHGFPLRARQLTGAALLAIVLPAAAAGEDAPSFHLGGRAQVWYQAVERAAPDGSTSQDFLIRRAYVTLTGKLRSDVSLFMQVGGDRIGQQGLDVPGLGVGTGVALRDVWIAWEPNAGFHAQVGRMCIPFTRSFGTEAAFALLSLDVPVSQGGTRGALFYASKVGRDDGVMVWGTPFAGRLQYRFGVMEGVEGAGNPSDSLRVAGRLAWNLLEPETAWATRGTYLGSKKVLAIGVGVDRQSDLATSTLPSFDSRAWTADVFFDHPLRGGAVTVEAAFTDIEGLTQALPFARLAPGTDARIGYVQAGYLVPRPLGGTRLQLYGRLESIDGAGDADTTSSPAVGANVLLRGQELKATAEWTRIDPDGAAPFQVITVQLQIAF